jgi:hypothetical protein
MKRIGEEFMRAWCVGAAGIGMALLSATPSLAAPCIVIAPSPLIGVTGPYGILAAGIGYGGYLLFKRLKSHS